eukprot:g1819.t1
MAIMNSDFTPEQVDNAANVGEIIAVVKEEIGCLKGFLADRDVEIVRRSTKGIGTNEGNLVNTLCNRTKKQIDAVDLLYHKKYESSLLKVVKSDVSGNFGKMITYSLLETDAFGAEVYTIATKGLGTKDHVLIDLCHTHTNAQLAAIKKKWEAKNNKSMLDNLNSELSGNARKIMTMLLLGQKSESEEVDHDLATEQAAALHAAGVKKLLGTDNDVFLDILGKSSRAQIQAIKMAYEKNHGMSLMKAISKECSGTYKKCLLACLFPSSEAYTAYALFKAFEGVGTDNDRVTRLLGGTDKKKMGAVASYYLSTYGNSLVEDLKDELSGTFLKAALCWVAGADPTGGMEYETEKLIANNDCDQKNLAKALLQERAYIKDFICQADCGDIREACKGLGTNDNRLLTIICGRTKPHLARVDQYYHSLFGMSLEAQIKHECFGVYKDFLVYTTLPEADFDALMLKKAMDGLGTNEELIISILAPASNARLLAAKARHDQKYPKPLIDRLKSELSGSMEDVVLALIRGERQEDLVDEGLAVNQAKELHNAGIGKRLGTDKKTFIRILTQASRPQIQLIRQYYERNHGMSLEKAIKKECSGSFETMLLAMIMDPVAYYALQLKTAFKGLGSDKSAIARVLGGNDKPVVEEIAECYRTFYGQSLMAVLKSETSGKFRRAVLTWVCASDPVHAGNKLEEAFEGLPDDEPCAEDEVVVDRQDREEEAQAAAPPPSYHDHAAGAPPPQYGAPPPQYGAPPQQYGAAPPQYYQPPPPPPTVYYTSASPVNALGSMMAGMAMLGGAMAQGMGQMGAPPQQQQQQQHRAPPPPYAGDDDDDDDDDDDSDDDFRVPMVGASQEQMIELRRLARVRTKAMYAGDAAKVNRTQDRIKYLKWQIETNC